MADSRREELYHELVDMVTKLGYPKELGEAIASRLGTENTMSRMIGYLDRIRPATAEEMVDEMLAIMEDRARWIQKKESEYYNQKYNELLYYGLESEDHSIEDDE